MMRHLVEMMLVTEGKPWARALRNRRSEQGLPLLLPSMTSDDGDSVMYGWLRFMIKGPIHKQGADEDDSIIPLSE